MKQGYIKLHRKIVDWEWYDDINTKTLFIHILLMANFEDKRWHGELVKRGSFLTSYQSLSVQTGLSVQEIRTSIKKLISTNDITKISNKKNTLIIVPNYNLYQDNQQSIEQSDNITSTNNQQSSNKQPTTTNNDKNIKNEKNINIHRFEAFWKSYPKKVDKKKSKEKFIKICKNQEMFEQIMNALNCQIKSEQWQKDNGRFIPNPTTWLNGERWNDVLDIIPQKEERGEYNDVETREDGICF